MQLGWKVVATDRSAQALQRAEALLGECFSEAKVIGDLDSREACRDIVASGETQIGQSLDLIINNAAANTRGALEELDEETAKMMFAVNVLAPLWLVQAARNSLLASRGAVINISTAQTGGFLEANHLYAASKAALEILTRTLAAEFLGTGVRVNAVRVGRVPGPAFLGKYAESLAPEEVRALSEHVMPLHLERARTAIGGDCVGTPQQIAQVVGFLASDAASFLNGQIITADGGFLSQHRDWTGPKTDGEDPVVSAIESWMRERR